MWFIRGADFRSRFDRQGLGERGIHHLGGGLQDAGLVLSVYQFGGFLTVLVHCASSNDFLPAKMSPASCLVSITPHSTELRASACGVGWTSKDQPAHYTGGSATCQNTHHGRIDLVA
jgi:hypothetical protein